MPVPKKLQLYLMSCTRAKTEARALKQGRIKIAMISFLNRVQACLEHIVRQGLGGNVQIFRDF